ncbi:MAG: hypothetical protein VB082_02465 [Christensenella sp.]|nr:hypothetical protein [Christensenella sp.]
MKKYLILTLAAALALCAFVGCSFSGAGKVQVIPSEEPAKTPEPEEAESQGLSDDQIQELIREGIVPEEAQQEDDDLTFYDYGKVKDALDRYNDKLICNTLILPDNEVLVQIENTNDVTVPMVGISLYFPDAGTQEERQFYQIAPGGVIVIPLEGTEGKLPRAVAADTYVSMNQNNYTDIRASLAIEEKTDEKGSELTITNNADKPCRRMSVTIKFLNSTGVAYAQEKSLETAIAPGQNTVLDFEVPDDVEEGFESVEYIVNEAVG